MGAEERPLLVGCELAQKMKNIQKFLKTLDVKLPLLSSNSSVFIYKGNGIKETSVRLCLRQHYQQWPRNKKYNVCHLKTRPDQGKHGSYNRQAGDYSSIEKDELLALVTTWMELGNIK